MFTATPRKDYLFGEDFVDGLDTPAGRTAEEINYIEAREELTAEKAEEMLATRAGGQ